VDTVIAAEGLTRRFGDIVAVDGLTMSVATGEVVGLLGHNGAGKTTTIRLLNGLLGTDAGQATVLGFDPATDGPRIRARTGVLTETPSVDERLTARENLHYFGRLYGLDARHATRRADELLDQFELGGRSRERVAGFSRGMKQRLALARAMIHEPELLFLDEPTAALDPVAGRGVHDLIRHFAGTESRTVVISTHNLVEAQALCDRVFILRDGQVIASGTPRELGRRIGGRAGLVVEVAPEQQAAAMAVFGAAGFTAAEDGPDMLHVDGVIHADVPGVVNRLVEAGIGVYRVSPAEPTLEDAYFALYDARPTPAADDQ
jgi:ABC-2 type transport system ATP-binding protein